MLRIIGNRIILPKGDTGAFKLPVSSEGNAVAVFSVFDKLTRKTVIEKIFTPADGAVCVTLEQNDTKDLEVGKYFWDIKMYYAPIYDEDGVLIDAQKIDSYYATHKMATFIIAEAGKNYE